MDRIIISGLPLLCRIGVPDIERAARIFLGEFRDGTLGKITLETPEDMARAADDDG